MKRIFLSLVILFLLLLLTVGGVFLYMRFVQRGEEEGKVLFRYPREVQEAGVTGVRNFLDTEVCPDPNRIVDNFPDPFNCNVFYRCLQRDDEWFNTRHVCPYGFSFYHNRCVETYLSDCFYFPLEPLDSFATQ